MSTSTVENYGSYHDDVAPDVCTLNICSFTRTHLIKERDFRKKHVNYSPCVKNWLRNKFVEELKRCCNKWPSCVPYVSIPYNLFLNSLRKPIMQSYSHRPLQSLSIKYNNIVRTWHTHTLHARFRGQYIFRSSLRHTSVFVNRPQQIDITLSIINRRRTEMLRQEWKNDRKNTHRHSKTHR